MLKMVNIKKSRLIESAKSEVKGFAEMYAKLEQDWPNSKGALHDSVMREGTAYADGRASRWTCTFNSD